MATRDRSNLFQQYRNSFGKSGHSAAASLGSGGRYTDEDTARLLKQKAGDPVSIEMGALPPQWMDLADEVSADIAKLKENIIKVEAMHKKNLLPGFDEQDRDKAAIDSLTQSITNNFHAVQKRIKKIGDESAMYSSKEERVLGKNAMTNLALTLQELSTRFRQSQSSYLAKLQGRQSRKNDIFAPSPLDTAMPTNFNMGFSEQQLVTIQSNEAVIDKKAKEINDIANSINQLAEIFRDLNTMIVDQGTLLDRIDYNIEEMAVNIVAGHEELVKGEKYQKSPKMRNLLIFLVIMVVVLLVAVIIKKRSTRN